MLEMSELLELMIQEGASDLHLTVDNPPTFRLHGGLIAIEATALTPENTVHLMQSITPKMKQEELNRIGGTDFGYAFNEDVRFRVSAFRQKGYVVLVLRMIPDTLLTLEEIGLPPKIKNLLFKPRGLILLTGPTGCGKSTTLASMINVINEEIDNHIITIEDPIEFYHKHKKSIVNQREVGSDVPSFSEGLRRALRQDPDIILVGELRDLETIQIAITAAETGHLVLGTLHTTGCPETIDRIIDVFPPDHQAQIRAQLAMSIQVVVSQLLIPTKDGDGRVAAFEIMIATTSIKALIREHKTHQILSAIQTGAKYGMNILDDHLISLYKRDLVAYDTLLSKVRDPDAIIAQFGEETKGGQ